MVLVLTTFIFMTSTTKKDTNLDYILYIYYLIYFWKINNKVKALIDFYNKINVMILIYTLKLSLQVWKTNIGA